MLRCHFCSEIAMFECSQNRFCNSHKLEHYKTHEGGHYFKDIYCRLSKDDDTKFRNEISKRLITLKTCKKLFIQATAEYFKNIQALLSEKIEKIDRQCQFYINLVNKLGFDEDDSVEIEKILSTRLELKELEHFNDSAFKEFIQQEIVLSKFSALLSDDGIFLVDVLRLCNPKGIPERMVSEIMVTSHGENRWTKAKEELINLQLVNIDGNSNLWSIIESRISDLRDGEVLVNAREECVKFCATTFLIDYDIKKNSQKAKEMCEILPHVEKIIDENKIRNDNEGTALLNLGRAYHFLEYNEIKAQKYLEELIQNLKSKKYKKYVAQKLFFCLGELYYSLQKEYEAEKFYLECLKIQERFLPENHPDRASLYMNLGYLYQSTAEYELSENYYLNSLKMREKFLPENHPDKAELFMNLGNLYKKKQDNDKATDFYLKSLKIYKQLLPKNQLKQASLYMNLGVLYFQRENYKTAENFYLKCLKLQEKILPENHPDQAALYMNLGNLYRNIDDYNTSENFYQKCLKIRQEILPGIHPLQASLYMNFGLLFYKKADYDTAENFYFKTLKIQELFISENHPNRATLCMYLGMLYDSKADYDTAEKFYLRCLKIHEKIMPEKNSERASLCMNLGGLYNRKSDYDTAERFYLKYLEIIEQILPENHPDQARLYINLKNLQKNEEDNDTTEKFYLKCLKILSQILPEHHSDKARLDVNLDGLYESKPKNEEPQNSFI